jgi:hypothetical protein
MTPRKFISILTWRDLAKAIFQFAQFFDYKDSEPHGVVWIVPEKDGTMLFTLQLKSPCLKPLPCKRSLARTRKGKR